MFVCADYAATTPSGLWKIWFQCVRLCLPLSSELVHMVSAAHVDIKEGNWEGCLAKDG